MDTLQYDFSMLQRLANSQTPIIGISRPGERPFAFRRKVLAELIEGLPASTSVALNGRLEIKAPGRSYALNSLNMWEWNGHNYPRGNKYQGELRQWAARTLDKMTAPKKDRAASQKAALLKRIGIEERKAEKLNPWGGSHLFNLEYAPFSSNHAHYRKEFSEWYAQKPMRRNLGKIATQHGLWHGGIMAKKCYGLPIQNPAGMYKELQEATGTEPRKYGSLGQSRWRDKPSDNAYLKHIYEYCGLDQKPYPLSKCSDWRSTRNERLPKEREEYCDKKREYKNQLAYVQYLKDQLASFEPVRLAL